MKPILVVGGRQSEFAPIYKKKTSGAKISDLDG